MINRFWIHIMKRASYGMSHVIAFVKWICMGLITGSTVGLLGSAFSWALGLANGYRAENSWIKLLLPMAGLLIVTLYRITRNTRDTGTNMVIDSIQSGTPITYSMAPLVMVSTVLTHLCGGSAGREGAALQLGAGTANFMSDIRFFRFTESDHKVNVMCGMSAGFAALFGTPMAAAIFSMEVISVGMMQYSALVPCIIAAFTARFISAGLGVSVEAFSVPVVPEYTLAGMILFLMFGAVLGVVSMIFLSIMHRTERKLKERIRNSYLRIFAAGAAIVLLTYIFRTDEYLGSGIGIIERIFENGEAAGWHVFALKILFTALTLGAGFKGGEIVPSFCIGAAFGSAAAGALGLPVQLMAACGMVGVFCGVTNCPITSLLIAFEMFGFEGMPYFLATVAVSYALSGYGSLYHTQRMLYSKIKTDYSGGTKK